METAEEQQRLTLTEQAALVVLRTMSETLRSIKAAEARWLDRYAVATAPAIAWVALRAATGDFISPWACIAITVPYTLLAAWVMSVLTDERRSYYGVLRTVVRLQNWAGLFETRLLPPYLANSPYPRGIGPDPETDGTRPESSHRRRLQFVFWAFLILLLTSIGHNAAWLLTASAALWPVGALAVSAAVAVGILEVGALLLHSAALAARDRRALYEAARREIELGLAGTDPSWVPTSDEGAVSEPSGADR